MRFKIGNWKFGNIPFTKPSPTQRQNQGLWSTMGDCEIEWAVELKSTEAALVRATTERFLRNRIISSSSEEARPDHRQTPMHLSGPVHPTATQQHEIPIVDPIDYLPAQQQEITVFNPYLPALRQEIPIANADRPIQTRPPLAAFNPFAPLGLPSAGLGAQGSNRPPHPHTLAGLRALSQPQTHPSSIATPKDRLALEAQYYKPLKLKLTPQTSIAYLDKDVVGNLTELDSGAFNTVFSLKVTDKNGAVSQRVFKPLAARDGGGVLRATGVDLHNPQIAMRNLATQAYANKLGFDVIPNTQMALLTTPAPVHGSKLNEPKLGLIMSQASGKLGRESSVADLLTPEVIRELTKLQLLDHLTAQGDRHGGNYLVDIDPQTQKVKVMGIDNDQCFGKLVVNPLSMVDHSPVSNVDRNMRAFRTVLLPPVVDTKMSAAINNISQQDLQSMLKDMLSPEEIEASVQRLEVVKAHLSQLGKRNCVIDENDWGSSSAVKVYLTNINSYALRDSDHAAKVAPAAQPAAAAQPPVLEKNRSPFVKMNAW